MRGNLYLFSLKEGATQAGFNQNKGFEAGSKSIYRSDIQLLVTSLQGF